MKKQLTVGSLIPHNMIPADTPTKIKPVLQDTRQPTKLLRPSIRLIQHGQEFVVTPTSGQTLLEAALNQTIPLDYKCQKGTCGRCTVKIMEGQSQLERPNQVEHGKLGNQLLNGYRLACQSLIVNK
ncbi:2Fe-2S iron-sulfur cluster-binding protein [Brevibacillus sp. SYSU BS000544]|uniref:2Fe-2S iron-sulfur cluster-binding protein n=1 Tax=Brevibacillus sp. SYSU BS000544 TaxID=3416443 RepID=UPI003CE56E79